MAGRKNYGVLTLQLKGQDSGLSATMAKASKSTKKYTGTIDGLGGTYTELSSKMGLAAGAMTMLMKVGTGLGHVFKLLTTSGDEWLESVDGFQEMLTTLPLGFGEAARASFEFGEMLGITSGESRKEMAALKQSIIDVRDEFQKTNKDTWRQTKDLQERAKRTRQGWTDQEISDRKKQDELVKLAADSGTDTAFSRADRRIEAEREKIQQRLIKGGMDWADSYKESAKQVNAIRTSFLEFEQAKVNVARAQLKRQAKDKADAEKVSTQERFLSSFRTRMVDQIEGRLGKGAAGELAALKLSEWDTKRAILSAYKAAVKVAQHEGAKIDLAEKLGVGVADLAELDDKTLKQRLLRTAKRSMVELDKRANTEFGRMLIAADHLAKIEGNRIKQEREVGQLAKTKAEQQKVEAKRLGVLTRLTRERTNAERDLLNVQRMSMGDQFTFQGFIGTMRIADTSDTNRLQLAHTEALDRVNMTLLNIDTQLQAIAT